MRIPSPKTTSVGISNTPLAHFNVSAATPEAFGAGIGRSLQNVAGAISKFGASYDARQQKVKTTDGLVELQKFNTNLQTTLIENRRNTDPAQSNHFEISEATIENMTNEFVAGLDPKIQESFRVRAGAIAEEAKLSEFKFGLEQEDAFFTQAVGEAHDTAITGFGEGRWTREQAKQHVAEIVLNTDLSEMQKAEALYKFELAISAQDYKRSIKKEMELNSAEAPDQALNIIRGFEGYRTSAYGDTRASTGQFDAWRVGYGSDTVVRADGKIEKVTKNTVVTKADAERTLRYRLENEFIPRVKKQVGASNYDSLPNSVKGVLGSLAWNYGSLPNEVTKAVKTGDLNLIADQVGKLSSNPERREKEAEIVRQAAAGYSGPEFERVQLGQDKNGYWTAPNISYQIAGKTRNKPVSKDYVAKISTGLTMIDPKLGAIITSGAQDRKGEKKGLEALRRTGSTRHDHDGSGEGHTSDFVLTYNGKAVTPGQNKELYAKVIGQMAAMGFTGIGHYAWGIHVGGGTPSFWGPDTTSATADPDLLAAYNAGRTRARNGIDTDPRFDLVTLEQRQAYRADAQKEIANEEAAMLKALADQKNEEINALRFAIADGKAGRADIEAARANGTLSDFTDYEKVLNDLEARDKDDSDYNNYVQKSANGGFFSQDSTDDKDGANAFLKKSGILSQIEEMDEGAAQVVTQLVEQQQFIAPNLMSQLNAMAASNNYAASKYAYQLLAQLQDRAPEQVDLLMNDAEMRKFNEWRQLQGTLTEEQQEARFNNARDPERRVVTEATRKIADDLLKEEYDADYVSGKINDRYWFNPDHEGLAKQTELALYKEFSTEFRKAMESVKDPDIAAELAMKAINRNWDKSAVGMPIFMKHPPQITYPAIEESHDWIDIDIRKEFDILGDTQYQLISDKQTAADIERRRKGESNQLPSYRVVVMRDGVFEYEEDRWYGEVDPKMIDRDAERIEKAAAERREYNRMLELQEMKYAMPGRSAPQEFPPELDTELEELEFKLKQQNDALRKKLEGKKRNIDMRNERTK